MGLLCVFIFDMIISVRCTCFVKLYEACTLAPFDVAVGRVHVYQISMGVERFDDHKSSEILPHRLFRGSHPYHISGCIRPL